MTSSRSSLALAFSLAVPAVSTAAPGIDRVLRTTPHLQLLIERSQSGRLDSLGAQAEEAWHQLARLTGFTPKEPIRIVFHDEEDYANGWAMASNGWVNVWLLPQPLDLRGGSDWTRNVLTHELSHIFTLKALGKDGYLMYLGLEARTESDRFQGDLDFLVRPNNLESWLTEGLAQVGAESCGHDAWDSHRDLLEHVAWKTNRTLPDGLLRTFWGDSRESELVYNQGYSFLRWVLSNGKSDLATLLRDGRERDLRTAIETSLDESFPRCLSRWKESLAVRHGSTTWPRESGRPVASPDQAATWVLETGAVGDDHGRIWLVSSRSNDFGDGSLWQLDHDGLRSLKEDVQGRPRLSPDGSRLAFLHEDRGLERRTLRDLWILDVAKGEMDQVTFDARIQEADFHPEGFVAIARGNGENRVRILGSTGHLLRELPKHPGGDLVQVAGDDRGRIVATSMGSDGFRLVSLDSTGAWIPLEGISTQARDPQFRNGKLWFSALDSGRWTAMSRDSVSTRMEARFEGGAFAPFPVPGDSLLVIRFQPQGLIAVKAPLGGVSGLAGRPERAPLKPIPSSGTLSKRPIPGNPSEVGSLVGYGLILGFESPKQTSESVYRTGDRTFLQGGALLSNSTLESNLEANLMIRGGPRQGGNIDFGMFLDASTEAWTPIFNASYGSLTTTLEYIRGSDDVLDSLFHGDTIPYLKTTTYELGALLTPSRWTAIQTWYDHMDLSFGVHGIGRNVEEPVRSVDRWMGAASFRNFESGRHGVLSGFGASLSGGRVWNWISSSKHSAPDYWLVRGRAKVAGHLARRLLLGLETEGEAMAPESGEAKALGTIGANLGIPLGSGSLQIPLTSRRGWTFVDPLLEMGHLTDIRPKSLATDDEFRPDARIQRIGAREDSERDRLRQAGLPIFGAKAPARGPDAEITQEASLRISWKAVTLSDALSRWSVGCSAPVGGSTRWSDVTWTANLSL